MFGRNYFKDAARVSVRVVDLCVIEGEGPRKETINCFDKEMSSVLIHLRFDEALKSGNLHEMNDLREQLYKLIDKSYLLYHDYIMAHESQKTEQTEVLSYLKLIHQQIEKAKLIDLHPRELLNLALIKLSMLRDFSKNESHKGFIEMARATDKSVENYIKDFLEIPLTHDVKKIKQLLGEGICSPHPFANYCDIETVLPLCSSSGSVGINTLLYALYKGYYPVGYGVEPHGVHLNVHCGVIENMRHDMGHNFLRVHQLRTEAPEQFKAYVKAYEQIVSKKHFQKIDNLTFKKDLLALFFLTWEIRFYPMQIQSAASAVRSRNIIDLIDFVKPLRELGYPVLSNTSVESYIKGDRSVSYTTFSDEKNSMCIQESIQANLIALLDDFKAHHPEIGLDILADLSDRNLEYAKALFQNPRYINQVTHYNDNLLLHFICEGGQVLIAKELLIRGADINARNRNGATPLHLGCKSENLELVKLLLSFGADLHAKQKNGYTPLDVTINESPNPALIAFLLYTNINEYLGIEPDDDPFHNACSIM